MTAIRLKITKRTIQSPVQFVCLTCANPTSSKTGCNIDSDRDMRAPKAPSNAPEVHATFQCVGSSLPQLLGLLSLVCGNDLVADEAVVVCLPGRPPPDALLIAPVAQAVLPLARQPCPHSSGSRAGKHTQECT